MALCLSLFVGYSKLGKTTTTVDGSTNSISADDLDELSEKPFNERTIKNLVRTAQALALSEGAPSNGEYTRMMVRVQEKVLREFVAKKLT
jgi:hypothetical protein